MAKKFICLVSIFLIKEDYRESLIFAGLERLLMPATVNNFRGHSFKLVQDKSMKFIALHSTIMHDKQEMYLHICKNINSMYYIFQEVTITMKICRTCKPTLDLFWFLKYFDEIFSFSCIPLITIVYKGNANFWDLDDANLIRTVLKRCLKSFILLQMPQHYPVLVAHSPLWQLQYNALALLHREAVGLFHTGLHFWLMSWKEQ